MLRLVAAAGQDEQADEVADQADDAEDDHQARGHLGASPAQTLGPPDTQDEGADGQQESGLGSGTEDFGTVVAPGLMGWRVGAPGRQRSARG